MRARTKKPRFDPNNLTARNVVTIVPIVVVVGILIVFIGLHTSVNHDKSIKFGGLTISTTILFGYFINDSREYLRNIRFWALTGFLLLLHLAAWISLLLHVQRWGLLWFNIMVFELPLFWRLRSRPGLLE